MIDVLANDTDPDAGDTLSVDGVTQPAHGRATSNGNSVTHEPDAGYVGGDSFTYTVTDGTASTPRRSR